MFLTGTSVFLIFFSPLKQGCSPKPRMHWHWQEACVLFFFGPWAKIIHVLKANVCKWSTMNTETSVNPKAEEIKQFPTFSKQSSLLAFSIQWESKLFLKYISNSLQLGNNCINKISKHNCFSNLPSNKITGLVHGRYKHIYLNLLLGACNLKPRTCWVSTHFHR